MKIMFFNPGCFFDAKSHLGGDFISAKHGQKAVSILLARPHKSRVYAHFLFIMKQQIRPVEQQIVPVLSQTIKTWMDYCTQVLLMKSKYFLIDSSKTPNWMLTI